MLMKILKLPVSFMWKTEFFAFFNILNVFFVIILNLFALNSFWEFFGWKVDRFWQVFAG